VYSMHSADVVSRDKPVYHLGQTAGRRWKSKVLDVIRIGEPVTRITKRVSRPTGDFAVPCDVFSGV
jgi:hypothetical protein